MNTIEIEINGDKTTIPSEFFHEILKETERLQERTNHAEEELELLQNTLRSVSDERDALRQWKDQQLQATKDLDIQAIGEEIGCTLGENIYPKILPWVRGMKAEIETIRLERDNWKRIAEGQYPHVQAQNSKLKSIIEQVHELTR